MRQDGAIGRRLLLNPEFDETIEPFESRRTMNYFANPYRKRISEYEKVLLYAQPNPDWITGGLGLGGWTGKFAGGGGERGEHFNQAPPSRWVALPGTRRPRGPRRPIEKGAGARAVVESLWAECYDAIETLFGLYMVYEPLFGRFARRELFYRHAALHGDHYTPQTMWSTLRAGEAASQWNFDLFERVLAGDPQFGAYNVKVMKMWAERWIPLTLTAMSDLTPLWDMTDRMRTGSRGPQIAAERVVAEWMESYAPVFGFEGSDKDLSGAVSP